MMTSEYEQNNKQYQDLKSFDLLFIIGLLWCSALLAFHVVSGLTSDKAIEKARLKAESLGHQVIQIQTQNYRTDIQNSRKAETRGTASVAMSPTLSPGIKLEGDIGEDPWNNPFHFKILISEDTGKAYLYIWSFGPDSQDETGAHWSPGDRQLNFRGNDIGVKIPFDFITPGA